MSLTVSVHNTHPAARIRRSLLEEGTRRALTGEGVEEGEVTIVLVDDPTLHDMNREHLGHDYETDVITFPIEEKPLEGEIYISVDRAREQAAEYGVTLHDELRRLAIHGALHLAGHDDATEAEREEMRRLEDRYLGSSQTF